MYNISLSILIAACIVLLILMINLIFMFSKVSNQRKIDVLKISILASFAMIIVAMVGLFFYFIVINSRLDHSSENLTSYKTAGCFKDPGVNLAIKNFGSYHK